MRPPRYFSMKVLNTAPAAVDESDPHWSTVSLRRNPMTRREELRSGGVQPSGDGSESQTLIIFQLSSSILHTTTIVTKSGTSTSSILIGKEINKTYLRKDSGTCSGSLSVGQYSAGCSTKLAAATKKFSMHTRTANRNARNECEKWVEKWQGLNLEESSKLTVPNGGLRKDTQDMLRAAAGADAMGLHVKSG